MTDTQQPIRVKQDGDIDGADSFNKHQSQGNSNVAPSLKILQDQEVTEPLKLAPEEHSSEANMNGMNGDAKSTGNSKDTDRFDPNFTQNVINATGPKTSPRMRKVIASLIRHVHDFARENEITVDEWMAGVEMVPQPHPLYALVH